MTPSPRGPSAPSLRADRWLLGLVLGALAAYAVLWRGGPLHSGDTGSYLEVARDLSDLRLERLHLRTPGYPALLVLSGAATRPGFVLVLVQLFLFFATAWSLARLLRDLGASRGTQWLFLGLAAMPHVVQVAYCAEPEGLTQALLTLGLVTLVRGCLLRPRLWSVVAASSLLGCAAITRPVFQVTAPLLAIAVSLIAGCAGWRERRGHLIRAALILPLGTVLLAGGFSARQNARFGASSSPLLAFSLAVKMAPYVESLPEDYGPVRDILLRHRDRQLLRERHHLPEGHIFTAWPELVAHFGGDEVVASHAVMAASLEIVRREPRVFLVRTWRAVFRYWEWYLQPVPPFGFWPIKTALLGVHSATTTAYWALLGSASVVGLLLLSVPRDRRSDLAHRCLPAQRVVAALGLVAVIVLSAMLAQSVLGVGHPRYHLPTDQLVLASVCLGLDHLRRLRARILLGELG